MSHTYIFTPGTWELTGTCTGASRRTAEAEGLVTVEHGAERWTVVSRQKIHADETCENRNDFRIVPFAPDAPSSACTIDNSRLGRFEGRLTVVGETIFATYDTVDGRYSGAETLRRVDEDTYEDRGVLFEGGAYVSSWMLTLKRRVDLT